MLGESTPVSLARIEKEREREGGRKRRKSSAVVTRNDALSHSWHETIIFSEYQGIERDPARCWRFIKRSRATLTRDFVVVVVVFSLRPPRRENRSGAAPAEPIVTQSVAWRACVQECTM